MGRICRKVRFEPRVKKCGCWERRRCQRWRERCVRKWIVTWLMRLTCIFDDDDIKVITEWYLFRYLHQRLGYAISSVCLLLCPRPRRGGGDIRRSSASVVCPSVPRSHATATPTSRSKGQKSRWAGGILWRRPSRTACSFCLSVSRITAKVMSRSHWNLVLWLSQPIGRTD